MSALDETLAHLRDSIRQGRGMHTSILRARQTSALPDALLLVASQALGLIAELQERLRAEVELRTAPHAFAPGLDGWCARCGGAADREELHPAELQVNEQSARVAQGGA